MRILHAGQSEGVKLAAHCGAFGFAALCCVYNAAAYVARRESRLAANAAIYGVAVVFEWHKIEHHLALMRRVE